MSDQNENDKIRHRDLERLLAQNLVYSWTELQLEAYKTNRVLMEILRQKPKPVVPRAFLLDAFLDTVTAREAQYGIEEVYPIWVEEYGPAGAEKARKIQVAMIILKSITGSVAAFVDRVLNVVKVIGP